MDWSILFNNWQSQNRYLQQTGGTNTDSKDLRDLKKEEKSLLADSKLFDVNADDNFNYEDLIQLSRTSKDIDNSGSVSEDEENFFNYLKDTFYDKLAKDINKNEDLTVDDMLDLEKDIRELSEEEKAEIGAQLEKIQNRMVFNLTSQYFVTEETQEYKDSAVDNANAIWSAEKELNVMNASEDNPFNDKLENLLNKIETKVVETLSETRSEREIKEMKAAIMPSSVLPESQGQTSALEDKEILNLTETILTIEQRYFEALSNDTTADDAAAKKAYDESNEKIADLRLYWESIAKNNIDKDAVEALQAQYSNKEISLEEYNFQYANLEAEAVARYVEKRPPVDTTKGAKMTTENDIVFKNGEPYTGLYNGICYVDGAKVNHAEYKNKYYVDGKILSEGEDNGILYKDGNKFNGTKDGFLYIEGIKYTGVYEKDGMFYKDGVYGTDVCDGVYYKDGVRGTGLFRDVYYVNGDLGFGICEENGMYYENGATATNFYNNQYYLNGVATNAPDYIINFAIQALFNVEASYDDLLDEFKAIIDKVHANNESEFTAFGFNELTREFDKKFTFTNIQWNEDKTAVESYDKTWNLVSDVLQTDSIDGNGITTATKLTLKGAVDLDVELDIDGAANENNFDTLETIPVADDVTLSVSVYEAITDGMTRRRVYRKVDGSYELYKEEVLVGSIADSQDETKSLKSYAITDKTSYEFSVDEDGNRTNVSITDTSVNGMSISTSYDKDGAIQGTTVDFASEEASDLELGAQDLWAINGETITVAKYDGETCVRIDTYDINGDIVGDSLTMMDNAKITALSEFTSQINITVADVKDINFVEGKVQGFTWNNVNYTVELLEDNQIKLVSEDGNIERTFKNKIEILNVTKQDGKIITTTRDEETGKVKKQKIEDEFVVSESRPVIIERDFSYEGSHISSYSITSDSFDVNAPEISREELNELSDDIKTITEKYVDALNNTKLQYVYYVKDEPKYEDFSFASLSSANLVGEYRLVDASGNIIVSKTSEKPKVIKGETYIVDNKLADTTYFQSKIQDGTYKVEKASDDNGKKVWSEFDFKNSDIFTTVINTDDDAQAALTYKKELRELGADKVAYWQSVADLLITEAELGAARDRAMALKQDELDAAKETRDALLANRKYTFSYQLDGNENQTVYENFSYYSILAENPRFETTCRLVSDGKIVVADAEEIPAGKENEYIVEEKLKDDDFFQDLFRYNNADYKLQKLVKDENDQESWVDVNNLSEINVADELKSEDDAYAESEYEKLEARINFERYNSILTETVKLQAEKIAYYANNTKTTTSTENLENGTKTTTIIEDKEDGTVVLMQASIKDTEGKEIQLITYNADGTSVKETQNYTYDANGNVATAKIYSGAFVEGAENNALTEEITYSYNEDKEVVSATIKSFVEGILASQIKTNADNKITEEILFDADGEVISTAINSYNASGKISAKTTYIGEYDKNSKDNKISEKLTYNGYETVSKTEKYGYANGNLVEYKIYNEANVLTKRVSYNEKTGKVNTTEIFEETYNATYKGYLPTTTKYEGEYKENGNNKILEKKTFWTDEKTTFEVQTYTYAEDGSGKYTVTTTWNEQLGKEPTVVTYNKDNKVSDATIEAWANAAGLKDLSIGTDGSFTATRFGKKVTYTNFTKNVEKVTDEETEQEREVITYSYTEIVTLKSNNNNPVVELVTVVEKDEIQEVLQDEDDEESGVYNVKVRFNGNDESFYYANVDTLNAKDNSIENQIQVIAYNDNTITVIDCLAGESALGVQRTVTKTTGKSELTTKIYMEHSFGDVKTSKDSWVDVFTFAGVPECEAEFRTEEKDIPVEFLSPYADVQPTKYTYVAANVYFYSDIKEITSVSNGQTSTIKINEDEELTLCLDDNKGYGNNCIAIGGSKKLASNGNETILVTNMYNKTGLIDKLVTLPNGKTVNVDTSATVTYTPSSAEKLAELEGEHVEETENEDEEGEDKKDKITHLQGTITATTGFGENITIEDVIDMDGNKTSSELKIKDTTYDLTAGENERRIQYVTTKDSKGEIASFTVRVPIDNVPAYEQTGYDINGNVTNNSVIFTNGNTVYVPADGEMEVDNENNQIIVTSENPSVELKYTTVATTQANVTCNAGQLVGGTITSGEKTVEVGPTSTVSFYENYIIIVDYSGNKKVYTKELNEIENSFYKDLDKNNAIAVTTLLQNFKTLTGKAVDFEKYTNIATATTNITLSNDEGEILTINRDGLTATGYSESTKIEGSENLYNTINYKGSIKDSRTIDLRENNTVVKSFEVTDDATIAVSDNKFTATENISEKDDDDQVLYSYKKILTYDIESKKLTKTEISVNNKTYFIPEGSEFEVSEDNKTLYATLNVNGDINNTIKMEFDFETGDNTKNSVTIGAKTYEDVTKNIENISITNKAIYIYDKETNIEKEYDLTSGIEYSHDMNQFKTMVEGTDKIELPKGAKVEVTNDEIKITTDSNPKYELTYAINKASVGYSIGKLLSGKVSDNSITRTIPEGSEVTYYGNAVIIKKGTAITIYDAANNLNQVDDNDAFKNYGSLINTIIIVLKSLEEKSNGETIDLDDLTKINVSQDGDSYKISLIGNTKLSTIYFDKEGKVSSYDIATRNGQSEIYTSTISTNPQIKVETTVTDMAITSANLTIGGQVYSVPAGATYEYDEATSQLTLISNLGKNKELKMVFASNGSNVSNTLTINDMPRTFAYSSDKNITITSSAITIYNDDEETTIDLSNADITTRRYTYDKTVSELLEEIDINLESITITASEVKETLISKYNSLTDADYNLKAVMRYFTSVDANGVAVGADAKKFMDAFNEKEITDVVSKDFLKTL